MNIFIPLLAGVLVGYILRARGRKANLDVPMSVALLLMIFFLGVKSGEVEINAGWLLSSSLVFAVLTIAGSIGMALLMGGRK